MDSSLKEIRDRIAARKEELDITYQDIADRTGMSKSTIQRYVTGDIGNLGLDKLKILASALEVSPSYLMGWEDPNIEFVDLSKSVLIPVVGSIPAGVPLQYLVLTNSLKKAKEAVDAGCIVLTEDYTIPLHMDSIRGVVDATGNPVFGARLAVDSIDAGKDFITLNVETDSVIGPTLLERAQEKGVIYTGSAGDEPGAIVELSEFALGIGFDLLVVGKGKNNALNRYAVEEDVAEEAKAKGLSPRILTSFVDATNTMIELTCAGNALGFIPDVPGKIRTYPNKII